MQFCGRICGEVEFVEEIEMRYVFITLLAYLVLSPALFKV